MALTVAQTADAGAPQAGITLDGLSTSVPCNAVITTSWDGGATWQSVRGGNLTGVLGSTFMRDYIPALNTSIQYRATLSATSPANAVTDPYATNAGEWLSYNGYGTGGAGTFAVNYATTGPDGSATTAAKKTWTTPPTSWNDQGIEVRADTSGTQWPVATSDGRTYSVWAYATSTTSKTFMLKIRWYNGATFLGETQSATVSGMNTWLQVSITLPTTLPYPSATSFLLALDVTGGGSFWAAGEWMAATWAMIAPSGYTFPGYPPATMTSSSLTINSSTAWIQDPLNPRSAVALYSTMLNGQVQMTIRSLAGGVWGQHVDTAPVIGAALAVASISQRQKIAALPLSLMYNVAQEGGHLHTLMMTSGQLVLRGVPVSGLLDPVAHCAAGDANETRYGAGTISEWTLTARQVRPVSMKVVVPWWTYDQVKALVQSQISSSATYAQVESAQPAGKTYTQWLANPGVAS